MNSPLYLASPHPDPNAIAAADAAEATDTIASAATLVVAFLVGCAWLAVSTPI